VFQTEDWSVPLSRNLSAPAMYQGAPVSSMSNRQCVLPFRAPAPPEEGALYIAWVDVSSGQTT